MYVYNIQVNIFSTKQAVNFYYENKCYITKGFYYYIENPFCVIFKRKVFCRGSKNLCEPMKVYPLNLFSTCL